MEYAGREITKIDVDSIPDSLRTEYNSFGTKQPGPIAIDGKWFGVLSCGNGLVKGETREYSTYIGYATSNDAMADVGTLMYALRADGEE